jgi:hypothetical protein
VDGVVFGTEEIDYRRLSRLWRGGN